MELHLLLFVLLIIQCVSKINLHQPFPAENENGMQLANEYQIIKPHNIILSDKRKDSDEYVITSIDPLYINNDDVVTVQFSTKSPSTKDWIGAYSPADIDITTTVPGKLYLLTYIYIYVNIFFKYFFLLQHM